jgi:hypothetical protein
MRRLLVTVAALIAALAVPASALAVHAPGDSGQRSTPAQAQVVRVVKPGGFDFRDAGIGAAVGVLALALVGGGVLVILGDRGSLRLSPRSRA